MAQLASALQWDRGRWIWLLSIVVFFHILLFLGDGITLSSALRTRRDCGRRLVAAAHGPRRAPGSASSDPQRVGSRAAVVLVRIGLRRGRLGDHRVRRRARDQLGPLVAESLGSAGTSGPRVSCIRSWPRGVSRIWRRAAGIAGYCSAVSSRNSASSSINTSSAARRLWSSSMRICMGRQLVLPLGLHSAGVSL